MRLVFTILVVLGCAVLPSASAQAQVVTEVASGDEIVVQGLGKVKLLGIEHTDPSAFSLGGNDAPPARTDPAEQRPPNAVGGSITFRREQPARDLLRQLVLGTIVRVEFDPLLDDKSKGAYIFVGDTMVNAEMVRNGRAKVDTSRNYAHQQMLLEAQKKARESGAGIWTSIR